MTSGGSRRRECLEPIKKSALCRPKRCAAPVQPCLSPSGLPHPEGKPERFSRLSSIRHRHLAGRGAGAKRPARSKGAKSRFKKLAHGVNNFCHRLSGGAISTQVTEFSSGSRSISSLFPAKRNFFTGSGFISFARRNGVTSGCAAIVGEPAFW